MRGIGLAVVMAAMVLIGPAVAAPEACAAPEGLTLTREPTEQEYFVPMAVAGKPKRLLLALDSDFSKLDEKVVDDLKLPVKDIPPSVRIEDSIGRFPSIAIAPEITLGPTIREKFPFVIGAHRERWGAADGVVGFDLLRGFDIELDIGHNRIVLFQPRP